MTQTNPKSGNGREWAIGLLAILLAISTGFNIRCYYLSSQRVQIETGSILAQPHHIDPYAALKRQIARPFIDPESVRWGEFKVIDPDTVCGQLNSKNRFGGYTGTTQFIWHRQGVVGNWPTLKTTFDRGLVFSGFDFSKTTATRHGQLVTLDEFSREFMPVFTDMKARYCQAKQPDQPGQWAANTKK